MLGIPLLTSSIMIFPLALSYRGQVHLATRGICFHPNLMRIPSRFLVPQGIDCNLRDKKNVQVS